MPSEEKDLDEAYSRYGKRLKDKMAAQDPIKDEELRARLEQVDRHSPAKSKLFADSEARLQHLKEEFFIEVQVPQTLQEHIVHLLAQGHEGELSGTTVSVADLYTEIHDVNEYRKVSRKKFEKALKQLEKNETVQLSEVKGTRVVKLRSQFLSEDEAAILDVAARKDGKASIEQIMVSTGWTQARVQIALDALISKKMVAKKKSFTRGTRYQLSEGT
ncbi:MAG: hypothetical protein ACFFCJ_07305 [Promethearchaeota archaeon]